MAVRLDGRVALVTGAGGGLGRRHALTLAGLGAKVVVNDVGGTVHGGNGDAAPADRVVAEIEALGGEAVAHHASIADPAGAQSLVELAVERFGSVDVLVNNAGILRDKTFAKITLEDFEAVLAVHLMGTVYCTHAAWPVMLEQGYGRVVVTTSGSATNGNFGQSNYAAAKLGVVGLMNVLALEGVRKGVLINAIAPGAATRMTTDLIPGEIRDYLAPGLVSPVVAYLVQRVVHGHRMHHLVGRRQGRARLLRRDAGHPVRSQRAAGSGRHRGRLAADHRRRRFAAGCARPDRGRGAAAREDGTDRLTCPASPAIARSTSSISRRLSYE